MIFITKLMYLLPKGLLSYWLGVVTRIEFPAPISSVICKLFVFMFSINIQEAEKPISEYRTIEEVFTRKLKDGARSISGPVISTADGVLVRSAATQGDLAVQVKGLDYSLSELVFGKDVVPEDFSAGWYQTVYLAPHNYHRVHSPVSGTLEQIVYIPGELWPVNQPFVKYLPRLFVRNERMIFTISLASGAKVHAVMVGALNVGRIAPAAVPGFFTNDGLQRLGAQKEVVLASSQPISAGDELGTFMLGSTVVVVFEQDAAQEFRFVQTRENQPILMGSKLADPS